MNYLAHIYLSFEDPEIVIGNFIADFISNKELHKYEQRITHGIMLHRFIDSFTDQHRIVRIGTKRLRETQGKYAPVVIDLLYDHILANNWHIYSDVSLKEYTKNTYSILQKYHDQLPKRLQKRLPKMIEGDFLYKYKSLDGLQFVLEQMDKRTKFPSNFVEALDVVVEYRDNFNAEFNAFFPEVIERTKKEILEF